MMTLEEYCKARHVSKSTCYRRLRGSGINLASLRDENGELTAEAIQMLAGLTDKTQRHVKSGTGENVASVDTAQITPETGIDTAFDTTDTHTDPCSGSGAQAQAGVVGDALVLAAQVTALRAELADTRSKLDAANARIIELLEQAAAKAEEHAKAMQAMAERSQEVQMLAEHASAGRGLLERIRGMFRHG